jgi:hypothetical protein
MPGMVRATADAVSAAYAQIMVDHQFFPGPIHTVFNGAGGNTGVAVNAFFFIDTDNRRKRYVPHFYISLFLLN